MTMSILNSSSAARAAPVGHERDAAGPRPAGRSHEMEFPRSDLLARSG